MTSLVFLCCEPYQQLQSVFSKFSDLQSSVLPNSQQVLGYAFFNSEESANKALLTVQQEKPSVVLAVRVCAAATMIALASGALCLHCRRNGHWASYCPFASQSSSVSATSVSSSASSFASSGTPQVLNEVIEAITSTPEDATLFFSPLKKDKGETIPRLVATSKTTLPPLLWEIEKEKEKEKQIDPKFVEVIEFEKQESFPEEPLLTKDTSASASATGTSGGKKREADDDKGNHAKMTRFAVKESDLKQLKEMFSGMPESKLRGALEEYGDVERAMDSLFNSANTKETDTDVRMPPLLPEPPKHSENTNRLDGVKDEDVNQVKEILGDMFSDDDIRQALKKAFSVSDAIIELTSK